jgi:hypothetical protein
MAPIDPEICDQRLVGLRKDIGRKVPRGGRRLRDLAGNVGGTRPPEPLRRVPALFVFAFVFALAACVLVFAVAACELVLFALVAVFRLELEGLRLYIELAGARLAGRRMGPGGSAKGGGAICTMGATTGGGGGST